MFQVYVYFNGYDVKGSPFMMRVGTQRRTKSNTSSPSSTYRQSPHNIHTNSPSPVNTTKTYPIFRTDSPVYGQETLHKVSPEKRITTSPIYDDRTSSPSYIPRASSPSLAPRAQSPGFARIPSPSFAIRARSPDYITSKRLNSRHETPSPGGIPKYSKSEHEMFTGRMSAMRIGESRSPVFDDGHLRGRTSLESDFHGSSAGVDTSPIVQISRVEERSAASARRDSWDAIAKTRGMLSRRSLESVANLADEQLDAQVFDRREEQYSSGYRSQNYTSKYTGEGYAHKDGTRVGGATAVKVQPVPDGVLGQPVEFESK